MRLEMQESRDSQREATGGSVSDQSEPGQDERRAVQTRVFTRWMNIFLQELEPPLEVRDLFTDIQDGRVLMALLEELTGCRLLYRFRPPSHRIFRLNNISKALTFLDDRHVKLLDIDASSVADGVPTVVLSLIWNIILHFQVKKATQGLHSRLSSSLSSLSLSSFPNIDRRSSSLDDSGHFFCNSLPRKGGKMKKAPKYQGKTVRALLKWVQRCTSTYGVDVHDFGRSWRCGLAFLALIKYINPDLVNLRESLSQEPRENLERAFVIAQHCLDVPPLLEPEDVMCVSPDEQSIITYVSMFPELQSDGNQTATPDPDEYGTLGFGSQESIGLGETLADDPKAKALLRTFEKSSEQQLWRRWSRRSLRDSHSATPRLTPTTLDLTKTGVAQTPSNRSSDCHAGSAAEESAVSWSLDDGSVTALDSDEEDAYSYILDLNQEVFQPHIQIKKRILEDGKPMREEPEVNGDNSDSILESKRPAGVHRKSDLQWTSGNFIEKMNSKTDVDERIHSASDNDYSQRWGTSENQVLMIKEQTMTEAKMSANGHSYKVWNCDDVKTLKAEEQEARVHVVKANQARNCKNQEEDARLNNHYPDLMHFKSETFQVQTKMSKESISRNDQSSLDSLKHQVNTCNCATNRTYCQTSSSHSGVGTRQSPAASHGLTPLELETLLLLWMLLYCCFIFPQMTP